MKPEVPAVVALWPYSERNGATAAEDIQEIFGEPAQELQELDRAAAQLFADGLYIGYWGNARCDALCTLESVHELNAIAAQQTFYTGYFETPDGQADLEDLGIPGASAEQITDFLHDVYSVRGVVDDKTRQEISSRSTNWYRDAIAECLTVPAEADADHQDSLSVTVHYNPDQLTDKFADLQAFRRFYREVWREMKTMPDGELKRAQQALLEVYAGRVNNLVAGLYPDVCNLAIQIDRSRPSPETERWATMLCDIAPIVVKAFAIREGQTATHAAEYFDGFARRLDLVRNGAAPGTGQYIPITAELLTLADDIEQRDAEPVNEALIQFSPEELAVMDETIWTADEFAAFNADVLEEWELLSAHTAIWQEAEDRTGRAPDGKWQVVVTPKKKSLSIDGTKGVVWVPEKFKRSLTQESPAGALPVSAHELTHVWQNQYDLVLAEQVPLAEVRGRRFVTVREMGGMVQEQAVQAAFGRAQTTNVNYLRALQVKLAGGTQVQSARAFYNSTTRGRELTADEAAKARDMAADRIMRLYRQGGHESQPLDYIEQDLLAANLNGLDATRRQAVIIAGGSFSWNDTAKLHRVGLFELPDSVTCDPAAGVLRIFRDRYLPQLVQA